jgi:hypothetical protein
VVAADDVDHADVGEGGDEQGRDVVDDLPDRAGGIGDLGRAAQEREALLIGGQAAHRPRGVDRERRARDRDAETQEVVV